MSKITEFFASNENEPLTVDSVLWVRSCTSETLFPVEGKLSGEIPEWLEGGLFMNGPGTFQVGDHKLKHLFDGMALLQKFNISNGKITYQNKFVKSEAFVKGCESNRVIFGEFGTAPSPDPSKSFFTKLASFASKLDIATDNTFISLYPISGSFYAMTETSRIHKINPETLDTIERIDLEGKFEIVTYTARPHIMKDGSVFNLGYSITSSGAHYNIVHFSNDESIFDGMKIVAKAHPRFKLHPSYSHSFGITENYFVIVETPLTMSVTSLIRSSMVSMPFTESLKWLSDENTRIILIDRATGTLKHVFHADPFYFLYIINQYEEDDHVVIDLCCYKNAEIIDETFVDKLLERDPRNAGKFQSLAMRFVLPLEGSEIDATADLNDGKVLCHPELLSDVAYIFPSINYSNYSGVNYHYFYAIGMDFDENYGAIIKVDVKNRTKFLWREENIFAWEPKFVQSPNTQEEDDGVILAGLTYTKTPNKTGLLILNAKNMQEIARCEFCDLSSEIPKPLSGCFVDANKMFTRC